MRMDDEYREFLVEGARSLLADLDRMRARSHFMYGSAGDTRIPEQLWKDLIRFLVFIARDKEEPR